MKNPTSNFINIILKALTQPLELLKLHTTIVFEKNVILINITAPDSCQLSQTLNNY